MKRVFLTGASSGIGLATARALVGAGHEIWGTSRNPERVPKLERLHPVRLDLRNSSEVEPTFASALLEAGHFDVLVNNAGSGHFGAAEKLSAVEIADQFQILFFAHVRLMQLALAAMRGRDGGLIVNVTSLAARLPVPFMAAYNSAKAAMAAFTMSMQLELGDSKVRIVDLQPADIRTPFNESVAKSAALPSTEERLAKTWRTVEANMATAPEPALVARHILRLIDNDHPPPRITVGDIFQSKIAPVLIRFLPQRMQVWGLKKYYGI
ncbi:MAG TPA: SDR family NAD(P)-dependent oxidoreductase [Chthoniobacterales bacterium]|jgi:NAD(P)-dependent dehydrogenase (short-subunit alcohol dehydrogenase family)|nr:SDR family NAD(P)-dependent oxidoreductase [Chthoniobacterales bacterium]